jgi:Leucine-rich repeat (LRR) protein
LPDELGNLPYLKEMHVGMNRLDVLPDTFTKLSHLEIFSATMNRLVAIPQGMGKLQHLRVRVMAKDKKHTGERMRKHDICIIMY